MVALRYRFERALILALRHLLRRLAPLIHRPLDGPDGDIEADLRISLRSLLISTLGPLVERASADAGGDVDAELRNSLRTFLVYSLPTASRHLIPSLERREAPVQNTWTYQNEVMEWDLEQEATVLDVGSGGWPFIRATHLADKHPDLTTHRFEAVVRDERPFYEVDLEKLPFADREYDFVFCSHVLEHIDNPGVAMRELMRVGKRGYIEVPTRLSDVMFNFTRLPNHHRWHGLVLGELLVLIEWSAWERRDLGNYFFDALQSEYTNQFQNFFESNRDLFFSSLHWNNSFEFLVIDKLGKIIDSSALGQSQ
jgi:SAM-dependent methyltransferase